MKKYCLLAIIVIAGITGFAQMDSTAPYFKEKHIPAFNLLSADSVLFTQNVLEKDKYTIIMLFNPECEHCQKETEMLLSMPELPQLVQIVMISVETMQKNKLFYDKYKLQQYPFIHFGRDFKYFCLSYFNPGTVPILVFYDKKGQLLSLKQGNVKKEEILEVLK